MSAAGASLPSDQIQDTHAKNQKQWEFIGKKFAIALNKNKTFIEKCGQALRENNGLFVVGYISSCMIILTCLIIIFGIIFAEMGSIIGNAL